MRITSRSAASREAQSESVATSGPVPVRVRTAAAARNRKGPAKRSFRGASCVQTGMVNSVNETLSKGWSMRINAVLFIAMTVSGAIASFGEIPKLKYAPSSTIDGFFFPGCLVRLKALPKASFPTRLSGTSPTTYIMHDGNGDSSITVYHVATLSTTGIGNFVEDSWSESKLKESGIQSTQVKKNVNNDLAIIEVDEIIAANQKTHLYQKIIKTPDGYAVITGSAECRKWSIVKDQIIMCVNSSRVMRDSEIRILGEKRSVVGIDVEGDVFEEGYGAITDENGNAIINARNYFLRPSKNKPILIEEPESKVEGEAEGKAEEIAKSVSDGKIHKLFGFEIGDLLVNYDSAKKLSDKKYRVNNKMKLAEPFTICKNVSCFYTAKGRRLFKITLSSDEYLNPDESKMRKRIGATAKAVEGKFGEELEMIKGAFGYSAKFKSKVQQKLSIDIVSVSSSKRKIVITFVDKEVELD